MKNPERKFEYRGSIIAIEIAGFGELISACAVVHTGGEFVGRVTLMAHPGDRDLLIERLRRKAEGLIDGAGAGGTATVAGAAARQLQEEAAD
jgi:hypothetical protein